MNILIMSEDEQRLHVITQWIKQIDARFSVCKVRSISEALQMAKDMHFQAIVTERPVVGVKESFGHLRNIVLESSMSDAQVLELKSLFKCYREDLTTAYDAETMTSKLSVYNGKELLLLPYSKIHFVEKLRKVLIIHTQEGQFTSKESLSEIEKTLPENFIRTHKSYIVNIERIFRINKMGDRSFEIVFEDYGFKAYASRYKAECLLSALRFHHPS